MTTEDTEALRVGSKLGLDSKFTWKTHLADKNKAVSTFLPCDALVHSAVLRLLSSVRPSVCCVVDCQQTNHWCHLSIVLCCWPWLLLPDVHPESLPFQDCSTSLQCSIPLSHLYWLHHSRSFFCSQQSSVAPHFKGFSVLLIFGEKCPTLTPDQASAFSSLTGV